MKIYKSKVHNYDIKHLTKGISTSKRQPTNLDKKVSGLREIKSTGRRSNISLQQTDKTSRPAVEADQRLIGLTTAIRLGLWLVLL